MKITSPIISEINVFSSRYESGSKFFTNSDIIFVKINKDSLNHKSKLLTELNNNSQGFMFAATSMYGPYVLVSRDINKFRGIVDHLYSNNLINPEDRSNLEEDILRCEKDYLFKGGVGETIGVAQYDVIKFMCEDQIDSIVELIQSTEEMNDFIGFLNEFPGAYKNYYNFEDWLIKNHKYDEEKLESFKSLGKIYNGRGNLEETYLKQGNSVPSLELQQGAIKELITLKTSEALEVKKGMNK
jgi:hypothetical protein